MMAPKSRYLDARFGPALKKTFGSALAAFIHKEFPHMGGPIVVDLFVQRLEAMVRKFFPPTSCLNMGQILWFAVAKEEKPSYGKTMDRTKVVPVVLTLVSHQDIKSRIDGLPWAKIRRQVIARLCQEAYEQGGVLAVADLALLNQMTIAPVSRHLRAYQEENDCILPYRGTVHDMGRAITHKGQICKKRVIEKKSVSETAQETHHTPESVQRYEVNLNRVLFCLQKGLNIEESSFVTKISKNLVIEYQNIAKEIDEAKRKQGDIDFDDLPF